MGEMSEKTRILVTHSVDILDQCDKVVVMKDGKIIE
jgi:ABC-type transport system involved in cytochrome bd biosynthesis fused ATPase/permease subunit